MSRVKVESRRINNKFRVVYELLLENEEYAISCSELTLEGEMLDSCCVRDISPNEKYANEIFEAIVKNRVCACTLYDIICDLIC